MSSTSGTAPSTTSPAASATNTNPADGSMFWKNDVFKYGILLALIGVLVTSFMCSFTLRRRAAMTFRLNSLGYQEELRRKAKRIPKVPPKLIDVHMSKDILRDSLPLSVHPLKRTSSSTHPMTTNPTPTTTTNPRFEALSRLIYRRTPGSSPPVPAPTDPATPISKERSSTPKTVQLAVMIAMPSPLAGAPKGTPMDDLTDMDITEQIGGTVEIGVARYRVYRSSGTTTPTSIKSL